LLLELSNLAVKDEKEWREKKRKKAIKYWTREGYP
jgi:hypothetical protein